MCLNGGSHRAVPGQLASAGTAPAAAHRRGTAAARHLQPRVLGSPANPAAGLDGPGGRHSCSPCRTFGIPEPMADRGSRSRRRRGSARRSGWRVRGRWLRSRRKPGRQGLHLRARPLRPHRAAHSSTVSRDSSRLPLPLWRPVSERSALFKRSVSVPFGGLLPVSPLTFEALKYRARCHPRVRFTRRRTAARRCFAAVKCAARPRA
jgi:hypothetical protein